MTTKTNQKPKLVTTSEETFTTQNDIDPKNTRKRSIVNDDEEEEERILPSSKKQCSKDRTSFRSISSLKVGEIVEKIIAIVKHVDQLKETRWGKSMCSVTICDDTEKKIRFSLSGKVAKSFRFKEGCVVVIDNVMVKSFKDTLNLEGISKTTVSSGNDIERGKELLDWWRRNKTSHFGRLYVGNLVPISITEAEKIAVEEEKKPVFINGRIEIRRDGFSYQACTKAHCNRKVQLDERGNAYWCEGCDVVVKKPRHRYCMRVRVIDESAIAYATIFDETAVGMIGMGAEDFLLLKVRVLTYTFICDERLVY